MRPLAATQTYWAGLDGLRALAVLAVVTFHAVPAWLPGGFWGVDLFFVLSGFLITGVLLDQPSVGSLAAVWRFYVRRWWRLAPALLVMLAVVVLVAWAWPQAHAVSKAWSTDAGWSLLYLSNWARAYGWHPVDRLGHTWSLAVEEQFYLLWPWVLCGLVLMLRRPAVAWIAVLILACTSAVWRWLLWADGATVARLYNGTDTRIETLLWGAALALAWRHWPAQLVRAVPWCVVPALAYLLTAVHVSQWDAAWVYQWGITATAVAAVVCVAGVLAYPQHGLTRWLAHPWLVRLGLWSYGIYLWHFPLLRAALALEWQGMVLWLAVCGSSLVMAAASYHWVERPVLAWRERRYPAMAPLPR